MPKDKAIRKIDLIEVAPQKKTLQQIKNNLNKKYAGKIIMASETEISKRIPTGILELDAMLGGGFPVGRIALLAGNESSYKSTICLKTIAECQKRGGIAAWIDAERSFDKNWAKAHGVDLNNLIIVNPETAEEAYDTMTSLFNDGVDIVVLDSLNTLVVKKEMFADEKGLEVQSIEKNAMGVPQKLASQFFRTAFGRIHKSQSTLLVISQMRDNLNAGMYGNPNVIVGGRAVKFGSSIILMTRIIGGAAGKIMEGDKQVGQKYEVKLEKSRFGKPGQTAGFDAYGSEIDNYSAMLKLGMDKGFIERIGTKTYNCNGRSFNGKSALVQALYDDKELYKYCMSRIEESYSDPVFSYDPYKKEDVEAKEAAKEAAKEYTPIDDDGIEIPEEDAEEISEE